MKEHTFPAEFLTYFDYEGLAFLERCTPRSAYAAARAGRDLERTWIGVDGEEGERKLFPHKGTCVGE